jgi:hypothetical protein
MPKSVTRTQPKTDSNPQLAGNVAALARQMNPVTLDKEVMQGWRRKMDITKG